jgi:hypothetical protein
MDPIDIEDLEVIVATGGDIEDVITAVQAYPATEYD